MHGRIALLSATLLLFTYNAAIAQQRNTQGKSVGVRGSKRKPTVHITFVRFGKREPRYNNESNDGVWLRVHNNTRWPLTFHGMDWFTSEDQEVRVFYGVEEVLEPADAIRIDTPITGQPPPPGSSVGSASPTETLSKPREQSDEDCEAPPGDWGAHVVAPITLPPGKSMIFSVPREALCKNLKIYLKYNYSWERRDRDQRFDYEPEHRVYFEGSDLVRSVR